MTILYDDDGRVTLHFEVSAVATYGDPGQPLSYQSQSPESVRQQHFL